MHSIYFKKHLSEEDNPTNLISNCSVYVAHTALEKENINIISNSLEIVMTELM
jgi:hypothetical protein